MASASEIMALTGGSLAILMACVIVALGPGRLTNRALGALLFFEGVAHIGGADMPGPIDVALALDSIHVFSVVAAVGCYLIFIGTIASPLSRPFRSSRARWLVATATLAALAALFPLLPTTEDGSWWRLLAYNVFALVAVYGLAVAIAAVRAAPRGGPERSRAVAYAWAFGARDVIYFAALMFPWNLLMPPAVASVGQTYVIELAPLLFVPLVAYGILRTQLFDIDIKIKRSISRGTLVVVFIAVFLVVANLAQAFLTETYGWLAGGVAASLLLLVIVPLQRAAERVADVAMPRVSETPEYLSYRKLQVYRATFEEMMSDGKLSPKERAALDRLRVELGIAPADAEALERDLTPRPTAAPAS